MRSLSPFGPKNSWLSTILFSGFCLYFSLGLSGNFWYLFWLAPVPLLLFSFNSSGWKTFWVALAAGLIGWMDWFVFLSDVITPFTAGIIVTALSMTLTGVVVFTRHIVLKTSSWYAVFAFPILYTSFEFINFQLSADGTSSSIAYSQSNFLPLIQITSVTGLLGITFTVMLIPATMAVGWYLRKTKQLRYVLGTAGSILLAVLLFGIIRLATPNEGESMRAGLVSLDEKYHDHSRELPFKDEESVMDLYLTAIDSLAALKARLIALPERALKLNPQNEQRILRLLKEKAVQHDIYIVAGYTDFRADIRYNSALVINPLGRQVMDYRKVKLIQGLESQFEPGNGPGVFDFEGRKAAVAICKDMDFPGYLRKYGEHNIRFLVVPAWDFVKDDWLHSRMAILRGVENGFSVVRVARNGRLTITDYRGRVTSEKSTANGRFNALTGKVSLYSTRTVYTRFGNYFGVIMLIGTLFFLGIALRRKKY